MIAVKTRSMGKLNNYLISVKNAQGTNMFRNRYVEKKDVLKDGELSCAYFVTTILLMYQLIDRVHFRVDGTEIAMQQAGWKKIEQPKIGCVIIWNSIKKGDEMHEHIGFCVEEGQAISNRSSVKVPGEHSIIYSGYDSLGEKAYATTRAFYWHEELSV